jgi:hypothetical protein
MRKLFIFIIYIFIITNIEASEKIYQDPVDTWVILDSFGACDILTTEASGNIACGTLDLSGYVPYTGATTTVNLGTHDFFTTGNIGLGTTTPATPLEIESTTPYITLLNATPGDAWWDRESQIIFRGKQSGGEESTLGYFQFSHGGTGDDEDGIFELYLNDGGTLEDRLWMGRLDDTQFRHASMLQVEGEYSTTYIDINNENAGEGDPYLAFSIDSVVKFAMGVDDSDGDKFKIGSGPITTNTMVTITSAGDTLLGGFISVSGTVKIIGSTKNCILTVDTDGTCDSGSEIGEDNSIAICAVCAAN